MNDFLIGVDLETINDYTSIAVVEQEGQAPGIRISRGYISICDPLPEWEEDSTPRAVYKLRHLQRHLGEPYTKITQRIEQLAKRPDLARLARRSRCGGGSTTASVRTRRWTA